MTPPPAVREPLPHERQAKAVLRATDPAKIDRRAPTSATVGGDRPLAPAPTPDAFSSMANQRLQWTANSLLAEQRHVASGLRQRSFAVVSLKGTAGAATEARAVGRREPFEVVR